MGMKRSGMHLIVQFGLVPSTNRELRTGVQECTNDFRVVVASRHFYLIHILSVGV